MRKSLIGLVIMMVIVLGLAACNAGEVVSSTPTAMATATLTTTPLPMPTPDPCAQSRIAESIKPMTHWMNAFDDTTNLAINTAPEQKQLITLPSWTIMIMDLQKSGRNFAELEVPSCLQKLQQDGLDYMNKTLGYLSWYMLQSNTQAEVDKAVADATTLRTTYEKEKAQLLGQVFILPTPAGPANATSTPTP